MPRSTGRRKLSRARLSKIPAWLIWSEGGTDQGPVPARLEALSRHGAVLVVEGLPLPPERSFAQVAVGGPPPRRYMTGWVCDADAAGAGPYRVGVLDHQPLAPVAFSKLTEELTKSL